jgi:hypothetical protein
MTQVKTEIIDNEMNVDSGIILIIQNLNINNVVAYTYCLI